jgi:hypothetical protein
MDEIYRQGDVLLKRVGGLPGREHKLVDRDGGRIVLAYGEATGHAHAIADREANLYETADLTRRFLEVLSEGGVDLAHEEHGTITLPTGSYEVFRQREYSPDAIRNVAD